MIMISVNMIRNDKVKQVLVRFEKLSQWAIPILTFFVIHSIYSPVSKMIYIVHQLVLFD